MPVTFRTIAATSLALCACGPATLSTGDTITVTVTPVTTQAVTGAPASHCGAPPAASCVPGLARKARVSIQATSAETGVDVAPGTTVSVAVTAGWLARPAPDGSDGDCTSAAHPNDLSIELSSAGAAQATWCFGDQAADGRISAASGKVTGTAQLAVPAVPTSVVAWASPARVAATATNAPVQVFAFVSGCDARPVAEAAVLFSVASGDLQAPSLLVRTDATGVATLSGTAGAVPLSVSAALLGQPGIECDTTIEVTP